MSQVWSRVGTGVVLGPAPLTPVVLPSPLEVATNLQAGLPPCSLARFLAGAWPVLNPAEPLIWNWHIAVVARHVEAQLVGPLSSRLERGADGRIRGRFGAAWAQNVIVNVPPGTAKSTILSVCGPAWVWTFAPWWRVLAVSGNPDVATRDSVACRRLIESEWYQRLFRPKWRLSGDQNVKTYFANSETGFRQSKGMGAQVTGDRPHALLLDDPLDVKEAPSAARRSVVNDEIDKALSGRIADLRTGTRTLIMQRLHEDDPSGHLLATASQDWEHLLIAQEFERRAPCEHPDIPGSCSCQACRSSACACQSCRRGETFLGWRDPRTHEGELLDPVRFPAAAVEQEKRRLGSDYAGQHEQRPAPARGLVFDVARVTVLPARPALIKRAVRGWDLAASREGAYTAGVLLGELEDCRWCVLDVARFRVGPGEVLPRIQAIASQDGRSVPIVGPRDPGQAGLDQATAWARALAGYEVEFVPQTGDKVQRAAPLASQVNAGNVVLSPGDWVVEYLEELRGFPRGKFKDQVDATSEGFNWLSRTEAPERTIRGSLISQASWVRK